MRSRTRALALLVIALLAVGCEPAGKTPTSGSNLKEARVWPAPPLRPRIRFVKIVAKPADLGIVPTFWGRATEFLFGKEEVRMVRPSAVASNGATIFVADPGAQSMWILDTKGKRFQRIKDAAGQILVSPIAVAAGPNGQIFLADSFLGKVFGYFPDGKLKRTIAHKDLERPAGLAYDARRDRLYVSDSRAHRIWFFSGDGKLIGGIGRRGTGDGAEFTGRYAPGRYRILATPGQGVEGAAGRSGRLATLPATSPGPRGWPSTAKATFMSSSRCSTPYRSSTTAGGTF